MATCPKCKKRDLRPGEDLCSYCKNKKTNFWVKAAEVALGVVAIPVIMVGIIPAVVVAIVKGGRGGTHSECV